MKGGREVWVRELWRGGHGPLGAAIRLGLLPLEWTFRVGVAFRTRKYEAASPPIERAPIPVLSVGNLSVGGTGKTPIASWVVRALEASGRRVAVVARGYGADEIALHRLWTPEAIVVADPDRVAGVREAARRGAEVAVLDDGFQHRRLGRDFDLVAVSAEQGLPGALLPRGPFREGGRALRRADAVVVTRKSAPPEAARAIEERVQRLAPSALTARMHLAGADLVTLEGRPAERPSSAARVVTAVAAPEEVVRSVEATGTTVEGLRAFPDHHDFTDHDIERALEGWRGPVVVTEKDAVKLRMLTAARAADVRVLRQRVEVESGGDALLERALEVATARTEGAR